MAKQKTLKEKVRYRIRKSKDIVFLVKDFTDLGGYDQILRALRELIRDEVLVKVGKGLYVKARRSFINGRIVPVEDMRTVAILSLRKLGYETCFTPDEKAYNEYKSTQVPNGFIIGVKKKITRKISFYKTNIRYELVDEKNNTSKLL